MYTSAATDSTATDIELDRVLLRISAIQTTNGEEFNSTQSARLFALIYLRFGKDWTATCTAVSRLLQNDPLPSQVAELVAVGLALMEDDRLSYDNNAYTYRERQAVLDKVYNAELIALCKGSLDDNHARNP
jgi:hypothetical protein